MARFALPLVFPDGAVRNLAGLKEKYTHHPDAVLSMIAGGDLERFFYGIARDDLKEAIETARKEGDRPEEIAAMIAGKLGIEFTIGQKGSMIVDSAHDLPTILKNVTGEIEFPRGRWRSEGPITITAATRIKGAGENATELSISHLVIESDRELEITDLAFTRASDGDNAESIISVRRGHATFRNIRFDSVRLETDEQGQANIEDCSFSHVSTAMWHRGDSSLDFINCQFTRVEHQFQSDRAMVESYLSIFLDVIFQVIMKYDEDDPDDTLDHALREQFNKLEITDHFRIFQNIVQNFKWPETFFLLGLYYAYSTNQDWTQANEMIRRATAQNYAPAQFMLGRFQENGLGRPVDKEGAIIWYTQSAEQGYPVAQFCLALSYDNDKNSVEAVKWYRKAAEQGYSPAQANLGCFYLDVEGVDKNAAEAVKWFQKAAEQGNALAQAYLGCCYQDGIGVDKNAAEAVKWYREAAEQGKSPVQYVLGYCYEVGEGVDKNAAEAVKWYRKAADQGNEDAKKALKNMESRCFITTAVVGVLGFDDHCHELMTLRRFRDGYLSEIMGGLDEIRQYYEIAPVIVEKVESCPDASRIWRDMATKYIFPCVNLIESGEFHTAHVRYRTMISELTRRFL